MRGSTPIAPIFILLGLLLLSFVFKAGARRKKAGPAYSKADLHPKPILTDHEREFFTCMLEALPHHHVFAQVSLDAILKSSRHLSKSAQTSLRKSFSQKHPDFVVCRRGTLEVVAIVELDDSSHEQKKDKDRARDDLLEAVHYRVERFSNKDKPWCEAISKRFSAQT